MLGSCRFTPGHVFTVLCNLLSPLCVNLFLPLLAKPLLSVLSACATYWQLLVLTRGGSVNLACEVLQFRTANVGCSPEHWMVFFALLAQPFLYVCFIFVEIDGWVSVCCSIQRILNRVYTRFSCVVFSKWTIASDLAMSQSHASESYHRSLI